VSQKQTKWHPAVLSNTAWHGIVSVHNAAPILYCWECSWSNWYVGRPLFGLLYQHWIMDVCEADGGMRTGRVNRGTRTKPDTAWLCPGRGGRLSQGTASVSHPWACLLKTHVPTNIFLLIFYRGSIDIAYFKLIRSRLRDWHFLWQSICQSLLAFSVIYLVLNTQKGAHFHSISLTERSWRQYLGPVIWHVTTALTYSNRK
jgi:hypothetical protein